ncbi:hypothetical protein [Streptomyces sp. WZ-12]|uniref:hypothetical protein n=1 Tax=Streptomyces sp. WZ-12 TaxID=3030210 RepID=UPI0023818795|nr:hypothetical protein [Streptomyces sp. WZ-12]
MATLCERQSCRDQVLRALYEAVEGNRLLGIAGAQLRRGLHVPEQDLADDGIITVVWEPDGTPTMVTLTHKGIRHLEAEEDETAGAFARLKGMLPGVSGASDRHP